MIMHDAMASSQGVEPVKKDAAPTNTNAALRAQA
jgi:hypothetical protein